MAEIGKALSRINYQGTVVMEPFVLPGGQVGNDIKIWRELISDSGVNRLDEDAANAVRFLRHAFGK